MSDPHSTSAATRATLFTRLATLERAGIPIQDGLHTLAQGEAATLGKSLAQVLMALERGDTLSEAGRQAGLWQPWEQLIIAAGQSAGRLVNCFEGLASHYGRQAGRWRQLRGKLLLPALALLIGVVVGPLPALVAGNIGLLGYLLRVMLPLLVLWVVVNMLRQAYQGLLAGGGGALPDRLSRLPVLRMMRQRNRIAALELLLDSSLSPDLAFAAMADSAVGDGEAARLRRAARSVENGAAFTATLVQVGLLDDPVGEQLLQSGEEAGRLPEMLGRYRARLDEGLERRLDSITGVLPWVVYGLVIAWVFM